MHALCIIVYAIPKSSENETKIPSERVCKTKSPCVHNGFGISSNRLVQHVHV